MTPTTCARLVLQLQWVHWPPSPWAPHASRSGWTEPAVPKTVHPVDGNAFAHAALVAGLSVHQAAYVPLQAREARPAVGARLEQLTVDNFEDLSTLSKTRAR